MGCMEELEDAVTECPHCGYKEGTPPLEAYHLAPETRLQEDRYIIGRVIGFGGFGVTYLAYDQTLQKRIAIKEYLPGEFSTRMPNQEKVTIYSGDKEEQYQSGKGKFIEEAMRLAKFQNVPEVVSVYDCFEENDTAYITMEYLDGESLKSYLEREGKMSVERALPIIFDILHALEAVHEEGILHRDIAPDNIYLTKDNKVKLLDFGAARFATTTHSRSLTVLIKPGYAPEEQYRSRGDQGTWTDVYAVAATFYKMITGIVPEDALERAAHDTLKPPSKLGVTIGPNTEAALLNALNVKISGRTQTAKAFEDELMANVVKRVVVKKQQVDIGRWPLWTKLTALFGGLGILGFVLLLSLGIISFDFAQWGGSSVPEGKTRVPNLVNVEMENAISRGEAEELVVQIKDKQYSDTIPENKVLSQSIKAGTLVDKDSLLEIVISAGIEKTRVPNVVGIASEEAIQSLKDAGLVVRSVTKEYRAAPDTIGWQSLEAQTEVDTGTEIEIIISTGISGGDASKKERVENLIGLDYTEASERLLENYLYLVKSSEIYSDEIPAGGIISQSPNAGVMCQQNSNIMVVVSLGKEMVTVPDIQFKVLEEARSILEEAGLLVEVTEEASNSVAEGSVIRQEIEAGQSVEKGSTITIVVSSGRPVTRENTNAQSNPAQAEQRNEPRNEQPAETTAADPNRNPLFDLLN